MELRSVISLAAYKKLVAVDLPRLGSNQHEINGVANLREFFGTHGTRNETIEWRYFADGKDVLAESGTVTFYDARESHETRTEWRLYYTGDFLAQARQGDVLILVRKASGELYGLVFEDASGWLEAAKSLFTVVEIGNRAEALGDENLGQELDFSKTSILDELGIEIEIPVVDRIADLATAELAAARAAGRTFPSTERMAELARLNTSFDSGRPDDALIALLTVEERIFRAIESILVTEQLVKGFGSVDEFIGYSLSVQNRRKARMGYALQNHLTHIFTEHKLMFETQATTEGKNRPDFLFPSASDYHDKSFDPGRLLMLAAKSSCKERWRQILSEAARISVKHLCTLEQAISVDQTLEMKAQNVILVVPESSMKSFRTEQQGDMLTIMRFVEHVKSVQRASR